jgi:hypothetical protein
MNRSNLLVAVAISLAVAASPAEARPGASPGASQGASSGASTGVTSLSVWGDFDPGPNGAGLGFRLSLPIVPQGLLHSSRVRDELVLEVGGDFLHYSQHIGNPYFVDYSWNGFLAVGGLAWDFWLTPQLALYPKLDLGFEFGWYNGWDPYYGTYYDRHGYGGLFAQVAAGLIYRLQSVDLRVELGTGLLRLGVGFKL